MIVYHGTTRRRAQRICVEGFKPKKPSLRVWFAAGRGYAKGRAKTQAHRAHDKPVVLTCEVDIGKLKSQLGPKRVVCKNGIVAVDGRVPVTVLRSRPAAADMPTSPEELAAWVNDLLRLKPGKGVSRKHPGIDCLARWVVNRLTRKPMKRIPPTELLAMARRWLPDTFADYEIDPKRLHAMRKMSTIELQLDGDATCDDEPDDERAARAIEYLVDPKARKRLRGLAMLAKLEEPDLFDWCVMLLDDESTDVVVGALHTARDCKEGHIEPFLPLVESEDKRVRAAAVAAIAQHAAPAARTSWLTFGLQDPCTCVRIETSRLLAQVDPGKHRDLFELALYDPNPQVRQCAQRLTAGKSWRKVATWPTSLAFGRIAPRGNMEVGWTSKERGAIMGNVEEQAIEHWLRRRDPEALRTLIQCHSGMVYATSKRILGDPAEAEDVTQECFEALVRSTRRLWKKSLAAWLHGIATKRSLKRIESHSRRRRREQTFAEETDTAITPRPDDTYAFVDEALEELPAKLRTPLVLHFLEGKTQNDIASELGVSRQTVTYRIKLGLARLAELLRNRGVKVTVAALGTALGAHLAEAGTAPASLTATLGKLALSQSTVATAAPASLAFKTTLAGLAGKTLAVGAVVALGVVSVWWWNREPGTPSRTPLTVARSDREADGAADGSGQPVAEPAVDHPLPADPSGGSFSCRAVDADTGHPLGEVELRLFPEGSSESSKVVTDDAGRFEGEGLPPGTWAVTVELTPWVLVGGTPTFEDKNGFGIVRFDVKAGRLTDNVTLELRRGATISGRVFDAASGKGLGGMILDAMMRLPDGASQRRGTEGRTDSQGNYTIEGVPPGGYNVWLWSRAQSMPRRMELPVHVARFDQAVTGADFSVDVGVRVQGRVVDASGHPVAGAIVDGVARTRADLKSCISTAEADGTFEMSGFMLGGRLLLQAKAGCAMSQVEGPWQLDQIELKGVVLKVAPGPVITGRLLDKEGEPVARAVVMATFMPENFPGDGQANEQGLHRGDLGYGPLDTTGSDGRFELTGLNPGIYGMQANAPGEGRPSPWDLRILKRVVIPPEPATHEVELVLGQPSETEWFISGAVVDHEGKPVSQARITARCGHSQWSATTDDDGRYRIDGLLEGDYQVCAEAPGWTRSETCSAAAGSANVDFVLQACADITGRVVAGDTQRPVQHFRVAVAPRATVYRRELFPDENTPAPTGTLLADGNDGVFEVAGLGASQEHTLFVRASGYAIATVPLPPIEPGASITIPDVKLQPITPVSGTVANEAGEPVPGARVYVGSVHPDFVEKGFTRPDTVADNEGAFTLDALPPDTEVVSAFSPGYAVGWGTITNAAAGARMVTVLLPKGGCVQGQVTIDGQSIADEPVSVRVTVSATEAPLSLMETQCDADGRFTIDNVAPGPVEVKAHLRIDAQREPSRWVGDPAVVERGQTTVADVDFPTHTAGLEGNVLLDGAPAPNAYLTVDHIGTPDGTEGFWARTDASGDYTFSQLPTAPLTVLVRAYPGDGSTVWDTFDVGAVEPGMVTRRDFELQSE